MSDHSCIHPTADRQGIVLRCLLCLCLAAGGALGAMEQVADTTVSVDRGIHLVDEPSVEISTVTPGATVRYTINGVPPTLSSGPVYDGPITITSSTTIRALADKGC